MPPCSNLPRTLRLAVGNSFKVPRVMPMIRRNCSVAIVLLVAVVAESGACAAQRFANEGQQSSLDETEIEQESCSVGSEFNCCG